MVLSMPPDVAVECRPNAHICCKPSASMAACPSKEIKLGHLCSDISLACCTSVSRVADCAQLSSRARTCSACVAIGHSDVACFHINSGPHGVAGFQPQQFTHFFMHTLAFCGASFQGLMHTSAGCCVDGPSVGAALPSWTSPSSAESAC